MYQEIKNSQPKLEECFFAFSKAQFQEGIEKQKIQDKEIFDGGHGLFGTKDGLDKLELFYKNQKQRIIKECHPQEVYDYEYANHECSYVGDDEEAILTVIHYFGTERAKVVKRKFSVFQLN